MDFEKIYAKLPEFIKYNNFILDFFLKIPKKIDKLNKRSNVAESQKKLFELILLNSDFKVTGISRNVQLLYLELLRFIDNVCKKHDINYWISDGTLIGAVRHGGFIPWDDDIDLSIMRDDYNKLIEVLPIEISKYEYFKQECGLSLLKDNHENYFKDFNGIYDYENIEDVCGEDKFLFLQIAWLKPFVKIDFFPKDYVCEDKLDFFKKNYRSTKYKFNQDIKYGKKKFDEEFKHQNERLGFVNNKTNYVCDALDTLQLTPAWIWETNKIFPFDTIDFEGYTFNCPNDINHFLSIVYGPDYMSLPDVIDTHDVKSFILNQFSSINDLNNKFEHDIKYLREINDKFDK